MTRDDILRLGVETNLFIYNGDDTSLTIFLLPTEEKLLKFAALVAAEKEAQMIRDGWRKCAEGQRTTQYCGLLDAAVKAEREACARVCDARVIGDHNREDQEAKRCAAAIRARGDV